MTEYFTPDTPQSNSQKILPAFTPSATTKVSEALSFVNSLEVIVKSMQKKVKELPAIDTIPPMSDAEISAFRFSKVPDPEDEAKTLIQLPSMGSDDIKYFNKTTAKDAVSKRIEQNLEELKYPKEMLTNAISANTIKPTDNLLDAIKKLIPEYPPQEIASMINIFPSIYSEINTVYSYIDKFIKMNSTDTSEETETETETETDIDTETDTTTTRNSVNNVMMGSLWSAMGPSTSSILKKSKQAKKMKMEKEMEKEMEKQIEMEMEMEKEMSNTVPDSTHAPADCSSGVTLSEETESRLVKNMMTQIKDQLLINRKLDNPQDSTYSEPEMNEEECLYNSSQQGSEWKEKRPDMSKYIRKDSIPCWNCSP